MKIKGSYDVYDFLDNAGSVQGFLTTRELTPQRLERHSECGDLFAKMLPEGCVLKKCRQVHGNAVVAVTAEDEGEPECDALCTAERNVGLMISVADCCPVFVCDSQSAAIGLAHSGKKGTQMNIVGELVRVMNEKYGCVADNLYAQIGACIRPPHYEMDIAEMIKSQLLEAGLTGGKIDDCGVNTGANISRYYSYRVEKGTTGRMVAVLCRR